MRIRITSAIALIVLNGICTTPAFASDSPTAAAPPPTPKWLAAITRVAYTDLPNRNAYQDWPDQFIEDLAKSKVQLFFSRVHSGSEWDGLAWQSQHGAADARMAKDFKDSGGDGTRHIVELCHKHGIRYLPYYWAQREPASYAAEHPDWRCVNRAGKPSQYFCVNNPEYRRLVRDRCVELVDKVGTDGVFFDMFHARGDECYCEQCKAKFRALTGQDPPLKEDFANPLWQAWVEFKYRSIEEAMLDFNRAIKAAKPEAALMVNTWNDWCIRNGNNARNSIRVIENVDAILEETGWYDTVDPSFFAFPTLHNYMSWHLAGLCKGDKRAFMWSSPSFSRTQSIGYTEAAIRVMAMMTNGSVGAQSVPGRDVMARYMADVAARDPYFKNDRMAPWCGLVVSEQTELWYGKDDPKARYLRGVYGAFQAMMERHLPVSLVTDRELELGQLEPHKVLFLPNCAILSDKQMETLRNFVKNGGGLVATYEASLYDEHGKARSDLGLGDLFGVRRVETIENRRVEMNFDRAMTLQTSIGFPADHPWAKDPQILESLSVHYTTQPLTQVATSLPLTAPLLLTEPLKGKVTGVQLRLARLNKETNKQDHTLHPGIVKTTYGKGTVIYVPFDISWSFYRYGRPYLSRLIELSLREAAAAPPPVDVAAPSIVQATTHLQGDRVVVHLLNDISSLGRSQNVTGESLYERREIIPIAGVRVTFHDKTLNRFLLAPGNVELKPVASEDGLTVEVPRLDIHAMVVAEKVTK